VELARWLECRIRSTLLLTENSAVLKRSVSRQMQAEDRRRTRVGQKTRISSNASKTMLDQVTLHLLKNPNTWEWINVVALFAAGLTGRCFTVHIWTKAGSLCAHAEKQFSLNPLAAKYANFSKNGLRTFERVLYHVAAKRCTRTKI